jgi:hypothetical protein
MTKHRLPALMLVAATLSLGGCDWFKTATSSETEMKNVEILPGTASDEMITLDQASGDGTAIDTSTAIGPAAPRPAATAAADSSTDAASPGDAPTSADNAGDEPAGNPTPPRSTGAAGSEQQGE